MSELDGTLKIGRFILAQHHDGNIEIADGCEGGVFNVKALEEVIAKFYNENF